MSAPPPPEKDPGVRDPDLFDLWLWIREAWHRHWWEILVVTGAVWATCALALLALNAI